MPHPNHRLIDCYPKPTDFFFFFGSLTMRLTRANTIPFKTQRSLTFLNSKLKEKQFFKFQENDILLIIWMQKRRGRKKKLK